jgi:hypothetical protein
MSGRRQWADRDDWMTTVIRGLHRGRPRAVKGEPMPAPRTARNRAEVTTTVPRSGGTTETTPSRRRRAAGLALAGAAVLVTVIVSTQGVHAQAPPSAQQQYDTADGAVKAAQARVNELFQVRRGLDVEGTKLSGEQREIAKRLEEARAEAQTFVVSSYISGLGPAVEEAIVYQESTTDLSYKSYFLKDRSRRVADAVEQQRSAFTEVDERIADYAIRRTDTATALDRANADLDRALGDLRGADAKLRAEAALRTTTTQAPTLTTRPPSSGGGGGSGNASSAGWAKLRQCEASGNYRATNGIYRGAYQFDQRTWNGIGGTGDPAAASPAEQDYRAQILYNQRGAQPWPVCGKNLINDPDARHEAVPP